MASKPKEPRGLKKELIVDWEALRRDEEALHDIFVKADPEVGRSPARHEGQIEIRAAHALASESVQRSIDALMRNPLFTGGHTTTVHSNGDGLWVRGDLPEDSRSGVAALRMRRANLLHEVGKSAPSSIVLNALGHDGAKRDISKVARGRMAPVQFTVEGDDWFTLCETGVLEEVCLFLVRGELETDIEGNCDLKMLVATPDAKDEDKSVACVVLHAEAEDVALPRIRIRSREGAMGALVWYSKREVQVTKTSILCPNPSSSVADSVQVVGAVLPVGSAAIPWARNRPAVDQSNTVHGSGQKGGQFSIHNPWNAPLNTRRLDVRLVIVPDGARDGDVEVARHPLHDEEMLIPLYGGIVACLVPRAIARSERSTYSIKELNGVEPARFMAAAMNTEGGYEPSLVFIDSQDLHGLASATYGTAVCLHILHSENANERRDKETKPQAESLNSIYDPLHAKRG